MTSQINMKVHKEKKNQSLQQHRFSPLSLLSIINGVRYWFCFKNKSSADSFLGLKSLFVLIFFKVDFAINVHYTKMMSQKPNKIGLFLTCHIFHPLLWTQSWKCLSEKRNDGLIIWEWLVALRCYAILKISIWNISRLFLPVVNKSLDKLCIIHWHKSFYIEFTFLFKALLCHPKMYPIKDRRSRII